MSSDSPTVDKVLELMNAMVAKDGGEITLESFDADALTMAVDYRMGINEECATCSITPELVQVFLTESLESHGVSNMNVTVKSGPCLLPVTLRMLWTRLHPGRAATVPAARLVRP